MPLRNEPELLFFLLICKLIVNKDCIYISYPRKMMLYILFKHLLSFN